MTETTTSDPRLLRDLRDALAWAERVHATSLQLAVARVVGRPLGEIAYVGAEAADPEVERGDVRVDLRAALGALGYCVGAPGSDRADRAWIELDGPGLARAERDAAVARVDAALSASGSDIVSDARARRWAGVRAERVRLARDACDVAAWLPTRHKGQSGLGAGHGAVLSLRTVRLPSPGEVAYLLVGQDMTGARKRWHDAHAALQALGWRVVGGTGGELSHIYLPDLDRLSWHARLAAIGRVERALGQAQGGGVEVG